MTIALAALAGTGAGSPQMQTADTAAAHALYQQHIATRGLVEQVRTVADGLTTAHPDMVEARRLLGCLDAHLLPHERAEEATLLPALGRATGGPEAAATLSRSHAEIEHQVARLRRLLSSIDEENVEPDDVVDVRGILYGLYAILRLHNAQEEETAFSLLPPTELDVAMVSSGVG
jgi:hypothetical protein